MYTIKDTLYGPIRGTATQALESIAGKSDYRSCVIEVFRLCHLEGLAFDPSIVTSQMVVETAGFTSSIWIDSGNPGGIGIDGTDGTDTVNTGAIKHLTGTEAAQAHILTLYIKVHGGKVATPAALTAIEQKLPAWFAHTRSLCSDPGFPKVRTIDDLNIHFRSGVTGNTESVWAWDDTYQDQIVAQATKIFGNNPIIEGANTMPDTNTVIVFGKVPHPIFEDRLVTDSESGAWDNIGQKTVEGVVWHRMEGTLWGTDGWFRRGRGVSDGLTEYGIGTANIDGVASDGHIIRWNNPLGIASPGVSANRSPWASGPVNAPYGDGLAFLNDHGYDLNVVNRNQAAMEIAGNYLDGVSQAAQDSIVALTAYWADQAKIPWYQFPLVNGKTYSFVRWHQEFTKGTGKVCPGQVVMDLTEKLLAAVAVVLKRYQVVPVVVKPPVVPASDGVTYVKAGPIPVADGFDKLIKGITFHACVKNVHITADEAPCHSYPDPQSGLTRQPLAKGQVFTTQWVQKGTDSKAWWVTPHGTRISTEVTDGWPLL